MTNLLLAAIGAVVVVFVPISVFCLFTQQQLEVLFALSPLAQKRRFTEHASRVSFMGKEI